MKAKDFENKYQDVIELKLTFSRNLSRVHKEEYIQRELSFWKIGLLRYEDGEPLLLYASEKALQQQERMVEGTIVIDDNGEEHTVLSKTPFLCGGEMCVRTTSSAGSDVYRCTFFQV